VKLNVHKDELGTCRGGIESSHKSNQKPAHKGKPNVHKMELETHQVGPKTHKGKLNAHIEELATC
jgi:hypothetical protein